MNFILRITFLLIINFSFSQEDAWVYFNDKLEATEYLANPLTMLSQKSLDRRTKQNIALDFKDVPISILYINEIRNSTGIIVKRNPRPILDH